MKQTLGIEVSVNARIVSLRGRVPSAATSNSATGPAALAVPGAA